MNKKAGLTFFSDWAEIFFIILIVVGIIIGIATRSLVVTYMVAVVIGMAAGRLLYERKNKLRAPYVIMVAAFIIGYVIGTIYGNRLITFLLIIFSATLIYYLLDKKIIRDTFV